MLAKLESLTKNKQVESIIQFGSSLHKKTFRDIDLCLFTTKKLTLKEKLRMQRNLPEKYDLSFYEDLPLNLKKAVISEGKIIFTKNYYRVLKEIPYLEREYPRYAAFLKEYHQKRMELMRGTAS
ncbi:nucleotidyltransferase domain-containing protein [Candidatus Woesearchaeota archaeon]|nr:nucleotidyltransferase domain-containing protein [Candidatus Woesearchaeota archaeon]